MSVLTKGRAKAMPAPGWILGAILTLALWFIPVDVSQASRPVTRTVTGCVIHGILYSFSEGAAYPLKVRGMDIRPFEGKKVKVRGSLLPGDTFHADPRSLKVLGGCDRRSRRAISESVR